MQVKRSELRQDGTYYTAMHDESYSYGKKN